MELNNPDHQGQGRATNAVRMYDPKIRQWHLVPPMIERRAYHGVAVYETTIYAVCGENDEKGFVSCYLFFVECSQNSFVMILKRISCKHTKSLMCILLFF